MQGFRERETVAETHEIPAERPSLREITDTEDDFHTAAKLSRVLDLALLGLIEVSDGTPDDIEALCHLSSLISYATGRLLGDFRALTAAGVFVQVGGFREARP